MKEKKWPVDAHSWLSRNERLVRLTSNLECALKLTVVANWLNFVTSRKEACPGHATKHGANWSISYLSGRKFRAITKRGCGLVKLKRTAMGPFAK